MIDNVCNRIDDVYNYVIFNVLTQCNSIQISVIRICFVVRILSGRQAVAAEPCNRRKLEEIRRKLEEIRRKLEGMLE